MACNYLKYGERPKNYFQSFVWKCAHTTWKHIHPKEQSLQLFLQLWASEFHFKDLYVWDGKGGMVSGRIAFKGKRMLVVCGHFALFWALLGQVWCQQRKTKTLSCDFAWAHWWEGCLARAAAVRYLCCWGGTGREEPCRRWEDGGCVQSFSSLPAQSPWVSVAVPSRRCVRGFNSCPSGITFI